METALNNFETLNDVMIPEDEQLNFTMQTDYFPGPGGENDDENDDDEEDKNNGNSNADSGDDNPPLDEEVVHSPLTTEKGGKPKP